jgi:hypothetical protein
MRLQTRQNPERFATALPHALHKPERDLRKVTASMALGWTPLQGGIIRNGGS